MFLQRIMKRIVENNIAGKFIIFADIFSVVIYLLLYGMPIHHRLENTFSATCNTRVNWVAQPRAQQFASTIHHHTRVGTLHNVSKFAAAKSHVLQITPFLVNIVCCYYEILKQTGTYFIKRRSSSTYFFKFIMFPIISIST